jgi:hypothetical protein
MEKNVTIIYDKRDPSVIAHIKILQDIINRMAQNSANCKTWMVAILSALLALYADGKICSCSLWICYIPTGLFCLMDCFYLGLERTFRKMQDDFVLKINQGQLTSDEIFLIGQENNTICMKIKNTLKSLYSFSILPFYGIIFLMIVFIRKGL